MSKAVGYAGAGALVLAGFWLMAKGDSTSHWEDVGIPSDEVLTDEAKLRVIRDKIEADPSLMTAGDWLGLEAPVQEYIERVEIFLAETSVHIYSDAVTTGRGDNGHYLTDEQARERALEMLARKYEEQETTWLQQFGLWAAEYLGSPVDNAVRNELVQTMKPVWQTFHRSRWRIEAIFDALRELPADTKAPMVDIIIDTPFTAPRTLDQLNPLEIFFAEGGRSDSYGLWWDLYIAADMAAQVRKQASELPQALFESMVESTRDWAVALLAESVGVLLTFVGIDSTDIENVKKVIKRNPNKMLGGLLIAAGGFVAYQTSTTP